jgi:ABC-type multidrug transport system ATPase subunit
MTLLALERVSKRYTAGRLECVVLDDASMSIDAGELVAVWGMPRSGRSTLLRIAAGIEAPDSGVVRFAGRDLASSRGSALGHGIGYCRSAPRDREGRAVLDEIVLGPRARGATHSAAKATAEAVLERVGAGDCARHTMSELDSAEALRVSLARALVLEPSLLLVDQPLTGVDLLQRDKLLMLLRSLADGPLGILMTVGETTELAGADRALSVTQGELIGNIDPELAPVVPIHRQANA